MIIHIVVRLCYKTTLVIDFPENWGLLLMSPDNAQCIQILFKTCLFLLQCTFLLGARGRGVGFQWKELRECH